MKTLAEQIKDLIKEDFTDEYNQLKWFNKYPVKTLSLISDQVINNIRRIRIEFEVVSDYATFPGCVGKMEIIIDNSSGEFEIDDLQSIRKK